MCIVTVWLTDWLIIEYYFVHMFMYVLWCINDTGNTMFYIKHYSSIYDNKRFFRLQFVGMFLILPKALWQYDVNKLF